MNKLFHSEADFVEFMLNEINSNDSIEAIENFLGIEFACESGAYPGDPGIDDEDDGTINEGIWRPRADYATRMPTSYPVIAVYSFSDEFDRFGTVKNRWLSYVYPSDFNA